MTVAIIGYRLDQMDCEPATRADVADAAQSGSTFLDQCALECARERWFDGTMGRPRSRIPAEILTMLAKGCMTSGDLCSRLDRDRNTINKIMRSLVDDGKIVVVGSRKGQDGPAARLFALAEVLP